MVTRGLCQGGYDRSPATAICAVALRRVVQLLPKISHVDAIGCGVASMYLIGHKRVTCSNTAPKRPAIVRG
jgi:hypothetical protein